MVQIYNHSCEHGCTTLLSHLKATTTDRGAHALVFSRLFRGASEPAANGPPAFGAIVEQFEDGVFNGAQIFTVVVTGYSNPPFNYTDANPPGSVACITSHQQSYLRRGGALITGLWFHIHVYCLRKVHAHPIPLSNTD